MIYLTKPAGDSEMFKVDDKTFYFIKETVKRRSIGFKDPLAIAKSNYKMLNMINNFNKKYNDLDEIIEKYIECIKNCIIILSKDHGISANIIFGTFDLKSLGIDPEEFGVDEFREYED